MNPAWAAPSPETLLTPEQLRADFVQLYEGLKSSHVNLFVNIDEATYQEHFEETYRLLNQPMDRLKAQILFQEFVALGRIAHARIDFPTEAYRQYREAGGLAFPIYVNIDDDQWTIADNYSEHKIAAGSSITHIDDIPVQTWLTRLQSHMSADTPAISASLLEYQLPQYLWLIDQIHQRETSQYKLTLNLDGKQKAITVANISRSTLEQRASNSASAESDEAVKLRDYRLLGPGVGYLKPGPFYNAENPAELWNTTDFEVLINKAFEYFIEQDVKSLVIDVRENPGGSNSFSDPLIAWFADKPFRFASEFLVRSSRAAQLSNEQRLQNNANSPNATSEKLATAYQNNPYGTSFSFELPYSKPKAGQRFEGEIYVLIDRSSYSNAVSLAAIVQDYNLGEVIGEASADFATTYASMESFTLDNSGISVGFPKAHIIRPSGDRTAGPVVPDAPLKGHKLEALIPTL